MGSIIHVSGHSDGGSMLSASHTSDDEPVGTLPNAEYTTTSRSTNSHSAAISSEAESETLVSSVWSESPLITVNIVMLSGEQRTVEAPATASVDVLAQQIAKSFEVLVCQVILTFRVESLKVHDH